VLDQLGLGLDRSLLRVVDDVARIDHVHHVHGGRTSHRELLEAHQDRGVAAAAEVDADYDYSVAG
jgi:hypothetical protein